MRSGHRRVLRVCPATLKALNEGSGARHCRVCLGVSVWAEKFHISRQLNMFLFCIYLYSTRFLPLIK